MNLSLPNQTQHGHINKHIIERKKEVRADCVLKLLTFPLKNWRNPKLSMPCQLLVYNLLCTHKEMKLNNLHCNGILILHGKLQVKNTIQKYNDKLQQL